MERISKGPIDAAFVGGERIGITDSSIISTSPISSSPEMFSGSSTTGSFILANSDFSANNSIIEDIFSSMTTMNSPYLVPDGNFSTPNNLSSDTNVIGEFPYYVRITSTFLCGFILLIGIIGNILVPVVVWRNKDLRSSTNIFLINLSLADLLILLVCMPPVLIELHTKPEVWLLGAAMCKSYNNNFSSHLITVLILILLNQLGDTIIQRNRQLTDASHRPHTRV